MLTFAEAKNKKGDFFDIKPYSSLPCRPKVLQIKGRDAKLDEFGVAHKGNPSKTKSEQIKKWGCPYKTFEAKTYKDNRKVADKYNLTETEYNELCKALEEVFSVGTCAWCV